MKLSTCSLRSNALLARPRQRVRGATTNVGVVNVWTRPTPDRDEDFIKPSYIPAPSRPIMEPSRRDETVYQPAAPEFRPAELPETPAELPEGPKLPERRPDPIPAGNPKEKPPSETEKREAPPTKEKDK